MNVAALVKQVPALGSVDFGRNGELRIDDAQLEMDSLSRRAVAQGVELAAAVGDGVCTALTIGAPNADDTLREALAWGRTCGVMTYGVLLDDPAFADGDTLATARTLAAAINREGPFDLVLLGAESSDVGTGQLGPQLAELLELPFAACARYLSMQGSWLHVRCEQDETWVQITLPLPAVVSCTAGLIDPCEMAPAARATVPDDRMRRLAASDLRPGPWGRDASTTSIRSLRAGATTDRRADDGDDGVVAAGRGVTGAAIGVLVNPDRPDQTRRLLGLGARVATTTDGHVVALTTELPASSTLGSWGADDIVVIAGLVVEEDIARVVVDWAKGAAPRALIAPASAWGREVAGRVAARLGAGLAGNVDTVAIDGGHLIASKAVYGGRAVAEVVSSSPVEMATVRADGLALPTPRDDVAAPVRTITFPARGRVRVLSRTNRAPDR